MIMQILLPDSGTIEIFGKPLASSLTDRIGYMPEERGLYKKMKVGEAIAFFGEIKGVSHARAVEEAQQWLRKLDLSEWAGKKIEERRGHAAEGAVHPHGSAPARSAHPDEPFSGLDPVNVTRHDAMPK
jgi:ABC-2 type transport system ATP-binding protein